MPAMVNTYPTDDSVHSNGYSWPPESSVPVRWQTETYHSATAHTSTSSGLPSISSFGHNQSPDVMLRSSGVLASHVLSEEERRLLLRQPELTSPADVQHRQPRVHVSSDQRAFGGAVRKGNNAGVGSRASGRDALVHVGQKRAKDDSERSDGQRAGEDEGSGESGSTKYGDYALVRNEILHKKYEVMEFLGRGTFGQVVKCMNTETRQWVAVKILKNHPSYARQGQVEVGILRLLNTYCADEFNFVLSNECFEHKGHSCVVFEMLQLNLYDYLKQLKFTPMPLHHIRPILKQVAVALAKLRELGIIHADLKPENIMLVDHKNLPFRVKVIDFGSALYSNKAVCSTYLQSRYYRAPEIILGLPFSEAIDIWSLGCVVAELFLGWPLFPGASEYTQIKYIAETVGDVPDYLLDRSSKIKRFFRRRGSKWELMSVSAYESDTGQQCKEARKYLLHSLQDLATVSVPPKMTPAEHDIENLERHEFIDFLEHVLVINSSQRFTPEEVLQHPFVTTEHLKGFIYTPSYQTLIDKAVQPMSVCSKNTPSHRSCPVHSARPPTSTTASPLACLATVAATTPMYQPGIDPVLQVQNMVLQRVGGQVFLNTPTHTCRDHVHAPLVPLLSSSLLSSTDPIALHHGMEIAPPQVAMAAPVSTVMAYQDLVTPMDVSAADPVPNLMAVPSVNEQVMPSFIAHNTASQLGGEISQLASSVAANGLAVRRSLAQVSEWGQTSGLWIQPPSSSSMDASPFGSLDYAVGHETVQSAGLSQSQPASSEVWMSLNAQRRSAAEASMLSLSNTLSHAAMRHAHLQQQQSTHNSRSASPVAPMHFRTGSLPNYSGSDSPAESGPYPSTRFPSSGAGAVLSQSLSALPEYSMPVSGQLARQLLARDRQTMSLQQRNSVSFDEVPAPQLGSTAELVEQATSPAFPSQQRFQVAQPLDLAHSAHLHAPVSTASLSLSNLRGAVTGFARHHPAIIMQPAFSSAVPLSPLHAPAPLSAPVLSDQPLFVFPPRRGGGQSTAVQPSPQIALPQGGPVYTGGEPLLQSATVYLHTTTYQ